MMTFTQTGLSRGQRAAAAVATLAVVTLAFAPSQVKAQDLSAPADRITLEMNNAQDTADGSCRLSLIASNGLPSPLPNISFEFVAFNGNGLVDQFLRVEFPRLGAGKTRVLQFDLSGLNCGNISRLHINDVFNCGLPDESQPLCADLVDTANRTEISFSS